MAQVTAGGDLIAPITGTVTFTDGATTLGTESLSNFTVTLSVSAIAAGNHSLTATYNGDRNYRASTSAAVAQTVLAAAPNSVPGNYTVTQIMTNATAVAINNYGQVAAATTANPARPVMWTPAVANGNTGVLTDLSSGIPAGYQFQPLVPTDVNDAGVVTESLGSTGYLWQPSTPNGTIGSVQLEGIGGYSPATAINNFGTLIGYLYAGNPHVPNGPFVGIGNVNSAYGTPVDINDYGQTIGVSASNTTILATPIVPLTILPNIFTQLAHYPVAINGGGTILSKEAGRAYLWTPASPNGNTGSFSEILPPVGFSTMNPTALNLYGQAAGSMVSSAGTTGFLLSGAIVYDLSVIANWPAGGVPVEINDRGQIAVNAAGNVYLLTPQPVPAEPRWSVSISDSGAFSRGKKSATLAVNISNSGTAAASDGVMVRVTTGFKLVLVSGANWNCSGSQCTRSDSLAPGASYPPITVTVSVDPNSTSPVSTSAMVLGGGTAGGMVTDSAVVTGPVPTIPSVDSVLHLFSSGATQDIAFQFSDTRGWDHLTVLNILINDSLDGRQACYLAYSNVLRTFYLVPDSGNGLLPGASGDHPFTLSNSQCSVSNGLSPVSQGSYDVAFDLKFTFSPSFSGNKIIYAAAGDEAGNTGWQTMGVVGIPPLATTFPNPVGMTPSSGTTTNATLTFTYQDATSPSNFQTTWALINTALDGRGACYVAYYAPANQVFLVPDNGDGTQATAITLGGTGSISNSQCTVYAQGSSVVKTGAQIAVTLNIGFTPAFGGPKAVWMAAQTLNGAATSAWQALGAWTVPGF
jgi:hypothetical protein